MKHTHLWIIVSVLIIVILFLKPKTSRYDSEIWEQFGLKVVESPDMDKLMKTLQEQKKAYDAAKGIGDKMRLRVDFEQTRMAIREWYTAKGIELGLDKDKADEFSMAMIMKNSI
jgi:hypothetical protein